MQITKFVAPEIIFGDGALSQIGECAARLGATKVFLVSDEGVKDAGWVDRALPYFEQIGLKYFVWTEVTPNPRDYEVETAAKAYIAEDCDAVVGLGGGSPLDLAKAVAILVSNGGCIKDYEGVNKIFNPLPPMVAAASTAGSGSEVSQFSVIVDTANKSKMTIISKSLIPDIAIVDPELLSTKDAKLTAATGMDALTHAIEAYVSLASTPMTEVFAINSIKLIAQNLRHSVASQTNKKAKQAMAMASTQAGLAFSNAILGMVHAVTHQLGGLLDMAHGEANAILLPYVMEYNFLSSVNKFADIARAFGICDNGLSDICLAKTSISLVREMAEDIGIPSKLSEAGIKEELLEEVSIKATKDANIITNPRDASAQDILAVLKKAL